jgi:hypothetical protein
MCARVLFAPSASQQAPAQPIAIKAPTMEVVMFPHSAHNHWRVSARFATTPRSRRSRCGNRRRLRPTATQGCPGCLSTPARRPRLTTLAQPAGWVSAAIKRRTQKGRVHGDCHKKQIHDAVKFPPLPASLEGSLQIVCVRARLHRCAEKLIWLGFVSSTTSVVARRHHFTTGALAPVVRTFSRKGL